jgi:hypothetical protein
MLIPRLNSFCEEVSLSSLRERVGMLLWESGTDIFVQDYVLTGYIAEVINTVSNLTYRTPSLLSHPLSSASSYFTQKYQIT